MDNNIDRGHINSKHLSMPILTINKLYIMKLKDLEVDHDYYCSDNNYYSNEAAIRYETFSDFYEEYHDADVDMNLVFRWDLGKRDSSERHYMQIFQIKQRKGIYTPIYISYFDEKDVELFVKYIRPHVEKLKSIWQPFKF